MLNNLKSRTRRSSSKIWNDAEVNNDDFKEIAEEIGRKYGDPTLFENILTCNMDSLNIGTIAEMLYALEDYSKDLKSKFCQNFISNPYLWATFIFFIGQMFFAFILFWGDDISEHTRFTLVLCGVICDIIAQCMHIYLVLLPWLTKYQRVMKFQKQVIGITNPAAVRSNDEKKINIRKIKCNNKEEDDCFTSNILPSAK